MQSNHRQIPSHCSNVRNEFNARIRSGSRQQKTPKARTFRHSGIEVGQQSKQGGRYRRTGYLIFTCPLTPFVIYIYTTNHLCMHIRTIVHSCTLALNCNNRHATAMFIFYTLNICCCIFMLFPDPTSRRRACNRVALNTVVRWKSCTPARRRFCYESLLYERCNDR